MLGTTGTRALHLLSDFDTTQADAKKVLKKLVATINTVAENLPDGVWEEVVDIDVDQTTAELLERIKGQRLKKRSRQ